MGKLTEAQLALVKLVAAEGHMDHEDERLEPYVDDHGEPSP